MHSNYLSTNVLNINLEHALSVKTPLGNIQAQKQMQVHIYFEKKYILIVCLLKVFPCF